MKDLKIEYIRVDSLTPYAANSKIHTKEQIQHIVNSINQFGFNDPLGIAGVNNVVLEGNGRIEAAKCLGMTELPCVRLDHLTENEQRAYVIAHNSLNLETGFDEGVLFSQLKELQESFDFESLGLDMGKYIATIKKLTEKMLSPYSKVHYLVSLDINDNDAVLQILNLLNNIRGVEIESTTN